MSFPALHRLWQLFLKGHEEVSRAALPIETAEMAILRAIHASMLPPTASRRFAGARGDASMTAKPLAMASAAASII